MWLKIIHCFPNKNTLWVLINFTLFGPIGELKLSNRSRAAIPGVCDFEFAQQILRHIIFSQGIHYKTLVSCRSITWPILGTFFTAHFPLFGLKVVKKIFFRKKYIKNKFAKTYEHDNYCRIMLPQHPPKIFNCLIEWSLSCYISVTIPERKWGIFLVKLQCYLSRSPHSTYFHELPIPDFRNFF